MKKYLTVLTWVFMILAVVFFWIGLRSGEEDVDYTLYALAMIAIAWTTNYFLKKRG